jgi:hypothetical protein
MVAKEVEKFIYLLGQFNEFKRETSTERLTHKNKRVLNSSKL